MVIRLLSFLVTLGALAGIALAGMELRRVLVLSDPLAQTGQTGQTARAGAAGNGDETRAATPRPPGQNGQNGQTAPQTPQAWPALFGVLKVAEPQPPTPPPPPAPPTPPAPPIASLGYALKGTVAHSASTWAILSHPTGERIVRVGDLLAEGITVVAIDEKGLWVETSRGREVLKFAE